MQVGGRPAESMPLGRIDFGGRQYLNSSLDFFVSWHYIFDIEAHLLIFFGRLFVPQGVRESAPPELFLGIDRCE